MKALLITLLVLAGLLVITIIAQRVVYGKGVTAPDKSFIGICRLVFSISFVLLFFWTLLCVFVDY